MFFDRSGRKPQSLSSFPSAVSKKGRNWAALGLAAAMAAPLGLSQFSKLYAQDAKGGQPSDAPPADQDLLRQGRELFAKKNYAAAENTLQAVNRAHLSAKDREGYKSLLMEVKRAAFEWRAAREEVDNGREAAKAHQLEQAARHFKAATENRFADAETVQQAKLELADLDKSVAPAKASPTVHQPATPSEHYDLAVQQYRKGDWIAARANFQLAQAGGYKPADLFHDSPSEYLRRMEGREKIQALAQLPATQDAAGQGAAGNANDPLAVLKATAEGEAARRQQARAQAQQWVKDAQEAQAAGNNDRALDLYTRAADADPANAAAVQGRDNILVLMGRNPSPANLPSDTDQALRARQGEIRYQVQSNLDQARSFTQQSNWSNAQVAIDRARVAAAADPSIFRPEDIRAFRTQIDQTELDLQRAQQVAVEHASRQTEGAVKAAIAREREQVIGERRRTVADLIQTSQNLTRQGRYREALQTVDQILILEPVNDYAVGVKPLLEDKTQFAAQRQFMEMRNRKTTDQFNRAEEELVPYDDILRYPTDWPDISQTRDQTVSAERGVNRDDRAITAQLEHQLPELAFDAVGFSDVVDFLRDVSGANLFVNWKSLEAAGIDRNTPVTARLHNIKFSKALNIILDSVGGGQTKLGYTIDDGVITISTADDLSKNVVVRVYDIRDLIINVPDFTDAPQFSLEAAQNAGSGGGGGGGGGGAGGGAQTTIANQLFANGGNLNQQQQTGPTREELVDSITKLITDTVATDSWKDNGGSVGALRELQGQLIVTQTPENHRQLVNLLEQLRETRAIQVTVETRFLTVERHFLEDIGVDLNFLFNLNQSWSKHLGTIPLTTPSSTFTQLPATGVTNSIGSGSSTPTGLTTSATYLDDFQVQLMLRATQASINSSLVTAPRITLFNGQRAYVIVSVQQAYVSDLTPVVSTGVSSFQPTIGIVQSGVLLDVQATVSADRKYVTLTMRPQLANLLALTQFVFQVGASGGGTFGTNGSGLPLTNGATISNTPTGIIQEPELQITEVKTTVSIPDGGTLLLGGQTVAGEIEKEVGTPVLSKIPFLKRLFTNRSTAKDEDVLLILARPTIILQKEIEQKQFPLLTSKLQGG